jgi:hypothetical protein
MTDDRKDLIALLKPFGAAAIKNNPKGGSYVAHPVVEQRLLDVLGPVDTSIMEVLRGSATFKDGTVHENIVVGVVLRMAAHVDGTFHSVEEVGDVESPGMWATDGARLKDAMSDAYKRCAMRLGVGLHLWAQEDFYLYRKLVPEPKLAAVPDPTPVPAGEEPF